MCWSVSSKYTEIVFDEWNQVDTKALTVTLVITKAFQEVKYINLLNKTQFLVPLIFIFVTK